MTNLLARFPGDLRARWMLNLAHMTLGRWPEGVPPAWRIGPEVFAPEAPFPRFPEVAGAVGLDTDDLGGGVAVEDFDGDGRLDAMVSAWGLRSPLRFFRQTGRGGFEERSGPAGLDGLWGGLNLVTTDYNNDGRVDVLVLRGAWLGEEGRLPNSLLRNNGDGSFTDVTEAAGLLSFHPTQTAAWFDFDGDGWLDLFIGNETQDPARPHPCELYRNNREGTFTEEAARSGVAVRAWVKGVTAGDYDGDGRPDLYLSVRDGDNYLFRNEGPPGAGAPAGSWSFREVGDTAGVRGPRFSFPTWFFDYDQDGRLDLFVSGYRIRDVGDLVADLLGQPSEGERARLYRNRGDG
ncbi:MAG: FG-GAP repeat domain-containing protein, partial [Verrucomicrobiota bacterium]